MRVDSHIVHMATAMIVALTANPVNAQDRVRLEGSVAYLALNGDDFRGTDAGIGFEFVGVIKVNSRWALGAGVQRTSHDFAEENNSADIMHVFAEPRFTLRPVGSFTPYVFARAGIVRSSTEDLGVEARATGASLGAGAGLVFGAPGRVTLHTSAAFSHVSFGDVEVGGEKDPNTDSKGTSVTVRAGVAIGFGSAVVKLHAR